MYKGNYMNKNIIREKAMDRRNAEVLSAKKEFEESVKERKEVFDRECKVYEDIKEDKIDRAWKEYYMVFRELYTK